MNEQDKQNIDEYLDYVKELGVIIDKKFGDDIEPPIFASIMSASVTPFFFWTEARNLERNEGDVSKTADTIIGQLQTRKLPTPAYSLLSRAVYRTTRGKDLRTMDAKAIGFKQIVLDALRHIDATGSVYKNIQKLMDV